MINEYKDYWQGLPAVKMRAYDGEDCTLLILVGAIALVATIFGIALIATVIRGILSVFSY